MKIGLIDIGSNTSKLLLAQRQTSVANCSFDVLQEVSLPCRLFAPPIKYPFKIQHQEVELLVDCLNQFREICQKYSIDKIRIVATEALRKSSNSNEIVALIEDRLGLKIEILSGTQEAMAVARGLETDPVIKDLIDYTALDIGGGSIEIIKVRNKKVKELRSLPIGAVRMAHCGVGNLHSSITSKVKNEISTFVQKILQSEINSFVSPQTPLVATGGTFVFLRKILEKENLLQKSGYIEREIIKRIYEKLSSLPTKARIRYFPEIPPDRADIFPFGILTILEIMEFLNVDSLYHSFHNLRFGLIEDCFHRLKS